MKPHQIAFLAILALCIPAAASAQWAITAGPLYSQKTGCLAVSGTSLYAGTDSGGVFLSTNTGTSWGPLNNGLTEQYVWSLTFFGSNLFAGTSGGVFVSSNSGANWAAAHTTMGGIGVPALAYRGTSLYAGTGGGVYVSTNNGTSWKSVKSGLTTTDVRALAFQDTNLFAGTLGGGVFLSTNGGTLWTAVNTNLGNLSVYALAVSGTALYAGAGDGVYVSTNSGASWASVSTGLESAGAIYALLAVGTNLFAGSWSGNVFLSTSGGVSWGTVSTGMSGTGPIRAFVICGPNLYAGTNHGVWRRPLSEMIVTSVEEPATERPSEFELSPNYPNPFNPSTTLRFSVGRGVEGRQGNFVKLAVYDLLGREVAVLVEGTLEPGEHQVNWNAGPAPSGFYLCRLQAGGATLTRKMLLLR
jgi:hypothetical protein